MKTPYLLKHLLGSLVFFAVLFISAGSICYWQGIIYVTIGLFMMLLNYTAFKIDAELSAERSKPGDGTKKWDKIILGLSLLLTILMYVTAGLDSGRFQCSPDFPRIVYVIGGILTATGQLLFLIAQKQNKFFSSTVRIQTERNHLVCDTGLYKIVRHPAYLGSIIQALGFPMLLGSVWSIIPVGLLILLFIVRTKLEDKCLYEELKGYTDYSDRIRYKLIPFIW